MGYCICLDTETTGLEPGYDEIIQLSIVEAYGAFDDFDCYYKPTRFERWDDASRWNNIYPEHVADKLPFSDEENLQIVQSIIDASDIIIGYNIMFDLNMLMAYGLDFSGKIINDVMFDFADFFGPMQEDEWYWSDKCECWKNVKLVNAAKYFQYEFKAHDSLEDVKATINVWENLQNVGVIPVNYSVQSLEETNIARNYRF